MWLKIKVTKMNLKNKKKHILLDLRDLYYFVLLRWMILKILYASYVLIKTLKKKKKKIWGRIWTKRILMRVYVYVYMNVVELRVRSTDRQWDLKEKVVCISSVQQSFRLPNKSLLDEYTNNCRAF